MNNWIIRYSLHVVALLALQVLVLSHINIGGLINPYIYPLLIILLPLSTPRWAIMSIAFFSGMFVDLFQNTLGMHAAAIVFIAFLRPYLLKILNPKEQEINELMDLFYHGIAWFVIYAGLLLFIHHLVYFFIEKGNFSNFFWTLLKVGLSTLFSGVLMMIYLVLVFNKSKKKY